MTPKLMSALKEAADRTDINQFMVGGPRTKVNPRTGLMDFFRPDLKPTRREITEGSPSARTR